MIKSLSFLKANVGISLLLMLVLILLSGSSQPPPQRATVDEFMALSTALEQRLAQYKITDQPLTFSLFTPELDAAFISPDGTHAVLWLALRDDSGRILATEPGFAVALAGQDGWQVLMPGDPDWEETLAVLPPEMVPLEQSPIPPEFEAGPNSVVETLYGYYLPYIAGSARWLEGSVSHFHYLPWLGYPSCPIETCHYAYDFTDDDHYPLLASKDGTVYAARDSCADGTETCTNYIVLRDTNNVTYQLYLHLAQGTIPNHLTPGVTVQRGQYLGDTDDTGYSTSQHVHFMVVNSLWQGGDGYYWGTSVDIRFADVSINNGIPRTCYEVTQLPIYDGATECLGSRSDPLNPNNDWFVSGNTGAFPPSGSLSRPAAGARVALGDNPIMDVTAWPEDDVSIKAVRLVAKLSGNWVEVGPKVTSPVAPGKYDWDVDLCAVGALNGPLEVALRVWDYEGNVASALSARTITVEHACPFPASALNPPQTFNSTAAVLSWDVSGPSIPIGSFDLQWRLGPGTWSTSNMVSYPGSQRSAWFVGNAGTTFAFRMRLWDTTGLFEYWPLNDAAEITATFPASCTPDSAEPDDSAAEAKTLQVGVLTPRNLCASADPDWFKFEVTDPGTYLLQANSVSGGAAVKIKVYDQSLATILAQTSAPGVGEDAALAFRVPNAGIVYIRVDPLLGNLMGTDAMYRVLLLAARDTFLPLIQK